MKNLYSSKFLVILRQLFWQWRYKLVLREDILYLLINEFFELKISFLIEPMLQ